MKNKEDQRRQLFERINSHTIELPDLVRMIRIYVEKNQVEFAKMVGVSRMAIVDLEMGRANPTLKTMNKILALIDMEMGPVSRTGSFAGNKNARTEKLRRFLKDFEGD